MRYILFSRDSCPFCSKAEELLIKNKMKFDVINFEESQRDVLEKIKEAHQWKTVPMVFAREGNKIDFVGGYTDLVEYLKNE